MLQAAKCLNPALCTTMIIIIISHRTIFLRTYGFEWTEPTTDNGLEGTMKINGAKRTRNIMGVGKFPYQAQQVNTCKFLHDQKYKFQC